MHTQGSDPVDPLRLYAALSRDDKDPFILETTVKDRFSEGRTFISSDPAFKVEVGGKGTFIDGSRASGETNPFRALKALSAEGEEMLSGIFVGYVAYDAIQECIGGVVQEPSVFGFYDKTYVLDHSNNSLELFSGGERAAMPKDILREAMSIDLGECKYSCDVVSTDADRDTYIDMVRAAKDYIYAGDAFQIVLSREYRLQTDASPFQFYRNLREVNPSPYLFLMDFGDKSVAGSSPETMASVDDQLVKINPIAGTTRRGTDPEEDRELAKRLLEDEKERAEHIMLVDLARNDIGKICEPRSISIPTMMKVRQYSHVQHIESEVTGTLRDGMTMFDAIESSFPAGTLTGAPKIRAMEIIDELEMSRRRVYGGCVGYFSTNGSADTAIAIRMAEFDDACRVRAGAGIVADSDPLSEYEETEKKMSAMLTAFRRRAPT